MFWAKASREFLLDPEKDGASCGLRRIAEACDFTIVRALGEYISTIDPVQVVREMEAKWLAYNILTWWRSA